MTGVEIIYESVKDRVPMSLEQFKDALKDWEFVTLTDHGKPYGAVMIKENEIHVGFLKVPSSSIRRYIKETIGKVIDKYGFATTSVAKGNEKGLKFCKRFGYIPVREDSANIYMKCDRCNYVR